MSSMKVLRFVRTRGLGVLKQLQFEEVLLRKSQSNYFILNNDMLEEDAAIVMGLSGKVAELVNVEHLAARPLHLIRRYTGGGTVVVDKSTLFATFIMNSQDVPSLAYPREIMAWSESVYGPVFDKLTGSKGFAMRENDYVISDRKIGGNAQTITKSRWVHHTSFLWGFDPEMMKYLLLPKKRPEYRNSRTHDTFMSRLDSCIESVGAFESALRAQLSKSYQLEIVSREEVEEEVASLVDDSLIESIARTRLETLENHLR